MRIAQVRDDVGRVQPPEEVDVADVGRDVEPAAQPRPRRPPARSRRSRRSGRRPRRARRRAGSRPPRAALELLGLVHVAGGDHQRAGAARFGGRAQPRPGRRGARDRRRGFHRRMRHHEDRRAAADLLQVAAAELGVHHDPARAAGGRGHPRDPQRRIRPGVGQRHELAGLERLADRDEPQPVAARLQPADEVVEREVVQDDQARAPARPSGRSADGSRRCSRAGRCRMPVAGQRREVLIAHRPDRLDRQVPGEADPLEPVEDRLVIGRDPGRRRRDGPSEATRSIVRGADSRSLTARRARRSGERISRAAAPRPAARSARPRGRARGPPGPAARRARASATSRSKASAIAFGVGLGHVAGLAVGHELQRPARVAQR